jgi:hypothetical protein
MDEKISDRPGDAYARGFHDGLERAAADIKPIVMRALEEAIDAAYTRGREAGRAEAREHIGEMCTKAYEAGRAAVANALTPEALKAAGERALELADLENEARDAQKH